MQTETVTVTTGESSDFTLRALSAASTVARLTSPSSCLLMSCRPKALHHLHRFQALLHDARRSWLCSLRTSWVAFFTAFLNLETKQQHERRDRQRDQGEVPVQPEHEDEHRHDGEQVNHDAEGRRRRRSPGWFECRW